jgi:hypothetical protein
VSSGGTAAKRIVGRITFPAAALLVVLLLWVPFESSAGPIGTRGGIDGFAAAVPRQEVPQLAAAVRPGANPPNVS